MKFGSVCSGIEAASVAWESLGFEAQWFSEIEHFPSEVLKCRYPTVPNLGDMTKLFSNKTFLDSHIDLLVGGTPCQSFSVAGLRKGMEDPRGNLTLTFLSLIDIKKPKWIVWENVPGIISSNQGKDFQSFLDGLEEIGYICDVEILDAQYFGVAQRRRRVFVCGQSVDSILKERTITSALTIAQCLTEILHGILIEVLSLYEREPIKSDQASLSRDGVMRRMKLFGILTENCNYKNWQELLVEVFLKHHPVQKNWDLPLGEKSQKELTLEDLLMGLNQEGQSTLTEESLRKALEDLYEVMKLYTTLTLTKETIQSKISIFFQAGESISRLIARLSDSSPNSLSATLSSLTLLQELTNYARQTNSDIFSEMAGIYEVGDFLKQAQHRNAVIGYLGDWRPAAAVLFESQSLQRDSKPSRAKRQETPTDAQGGVRTTGFAGNVESQVAACLQTTCDDYSRADGFNTVIEQVDQPVQAMSFAPSHYLRGFGPPPSENICSTIKALQTDQSPHVAQPFRKVRRAQSETDFETWEKDEKANTLNCFDQGDVRSTNVVAQPIAFQPGNLARKGGADPSTKTFPTLTKNSGDQSPHVAQPQYFESHPNDSRVTGPHDVGNTVSARYGTGGGNTPLVSQPISWDSEVNCNINKMGTLVRGGQGGRTDGVAQPIAVDVYNQTIDGQTSATLTKAVGGTNTSGPKIAQPISIAENTIGRQPMNGGNGDGFTEDGPMYTLNATGVHGVAQPIAYSFDSLASNSMKSSNPHSGCRKVETSKTIDTTTPEPSKNQGGIAIAQPVHAFKVRGGCEGGGKGYLGQDESAFTISTNQDQHIAQPISVDWRTAQVDVEMTGTLKTDLAKMSGPCIAVENPTIIDRAAFNQGQNAQYEPRIEEGQTMSSLVARGPHAVQHTMAIRRLTPKECERLQGFPDDWTKIPYRNKPADQCPDGPRYKACGNSMAVPVMRWIGQRIQLIDTILNG